MAFLFKRGLSFPRLIQTRAMRKNTLHETRAAAPNGDEAPGHAQDQHKYKGPLKITHTHTHWGYRLLNTVLTVRNRKLT